MQASGLLPACAATAQRRRTDDRTSAARGAVDRAAARGLARRQPRPRGLAGLQRIDLAAPARRARRRRAAPRRCARSPTRHDALRATFAADGLTIRVGAAPGARGAAHRSVERSPRRARRRARRRSRAPRQRAVRPRARAAACAPSSSGSRPITTCSSSPPTTSCSTAGRTGCWCKDLGRALRASRTGARAAPLPPAPSFADYAADRPRAPTRPSAANEHWWVDAVRRRRARRSSCRPIARARPCARRPPAASDHVLPADLVAGVQASSAPQHGASLFATLLAGFDALLHRLTGQTDLVVGIPAAGQAADGLGRPGRPLRQHAAAARPRSRAAQTVRRAREGGAR